MCYRNGALYFEGEWRDDKPIGRGVMFDENGNKKYEGEWENGLFHVKDKIWFNYMNGKEQKVVALEKNKVKKDKWLSIEEVADSETSKKAILKGKIVFALSVIVSIPILIAIIYGIFMAIVTVHLDVDKNTREIVIDDENCRNWKRFLTISGYPNLERLVVNDYACFKVEIVVIKNNPKLLTITTGHGSFWYTTNLTLSSIF